MNTLTIKLKQHTPLIHFQHDQDGATLRASEVKPKLDKYILNKLSSEEKEKGKSNGWIKFKGDKVWLDYKMRIEAREKDDSVKLNVNQKTDMRTRTVKYITEDFPFLIANMGGKDTEDELMNLSLCKILIITIQTSHEYLFQSFDFHIETFFALTNFGQRKTKGFGSFSVFSMQKNDGEVKNIEWKDHYKEYFENGTQLMKFSLNSQINVFEKQYMLFSVIDFYWRCLKSGINYSKRIVPRDGNGDVNIRYPERYIKAFLWTYLNSIGYTWEKRQIKNELHLETPFPIRTYADNTNNVVFARGLMGCPDKYEYRIPQNRFREDRNGRQKEIIENHSVKIKNISGEIERISSPIYFKPIIDGNNVSVYILFDNGLIDKLRSLPETNRGFQFSENGNSVHIPINTDAINYKELIKKFHFYTFTNVSFISSTLGEYEGNRWQPAKIKIEKNEDERIISRNWGDMNISWKMVPRNFRWENILEPSDNGKKHFVSFSQIVK